MKPLIGYLTWKKVFIHCICGTRFQSPPVPAPIACPGCGAEMKDMPRSRADA